MRYVNDDLLMGGWWEDLQSKATGLFSSSGNWGLTSPGGTFSFIPAPKAGQTGAGAAAQSALASPLVWVGMAAVAALVLLRRKRR